MVLVERGMENRVEERYRGGRRRPGSRSKKGPLAPSVTEQIVL
jgi:hypothetical protein